MPLDLEGPVRLRTHDFMVTKDAYHQRPVRRVIGVSTGRFDGRWSVRPDAVRFEQLVGVLPRSRIRGDVLLGFDNQLHARVRAEVADLRDIAPLDQFPIAGLGDAQVAIDGTFQDPTITGHVRLDDFLFDEFQLGNLESDATLNPDGLGVHFPMVAAAKNESRYRVQDLYLDFHQNRFALDGTLHLDGLSLLDFYRVFGLEEDERFEPYQGLMRGQAEIRYTNGYPDDAPSGTLDTELSLGFDWVSLNDYRFTDGHLAGRFRWLDWSVGARGAELTIAALSLQKGEGTVVLDGRMSLGGHLRMDAVADHVAISELEGIGDRLPGLDGVATAIGHIGGTFDVMHADFDVGVTNLTYDGHALGDGRFFVRLTDRDDPWVVEARPWDRASPPEEPCARARVGLAHANWPPDPPVMTVDGPEEQLSRPMAFLICGTAFEDRLTVDMALGRTEPLPVRGAITLDHLDLSPLLPTGSDGQRTEGAVSGTFAFDDGAFRRPETLAGSVVLTEVRAGQSDMEIRNRRNVELTFADGQLSVDKARFVGPDSRLRLRGRASIEDGLSLQVDGDVNLGILSRLTRSVREAHGHIAAQLSVTGPLGDPELYGRASVEGGSFRFASFEPTIENLEGRVEFSQRSLIFDDFSADVAGGHLSASGEAELHEHELQRYSFNLHAAGIRYQLQEGINLAFGARTRLAWSRGDRLPLLSGELAVNRLRYTRPIELRSLADVAVHAVRGALRQHTEVRRYDPEQDSLRLDVQVTQDAPFRIQNNLVDAEVRIETSEQPFRIVGTDQRYGLVGAMDISRGTLVFQNNEFDVRRGVIRFDDTTRIEPNVDIEAITEIRRTSNLSAQTWRVVLTLTGPSDDLRLGTRSEPQLPEPDILMLLAFGMTRNELQQLQQGGDLAGTAALQAVTAVTGVDREVRRAVPLIDDLRITNGYSPRTGRSEPRISVGRRIADRVRLSATTGLSASRDVRAALEVQLDENQRVGVSYDNYNNTSANSFGNLGIDWGFRLEFE